MADHGRSWGTWPNDDASYRLWAGVQSGICERRVTACVQTMGPVMGGKDRRRGR